MIKYKSGLAAAWQYHMHDIEMYFEQKKKGEVHYVPFNNYEEIIAWEGDIYAHTSLYRPILGDLLMLSRGPVTVIDNIKLAHDDPHFVSLSYITATWDNDPENRIIMRGGKGFLWGDA